MRRPRSADPSPYAQQVLDLVERVPPGRVVTYGDVAGMLNAGAARVVGHVLASYGSGVPWHRVVRADGTPPPHLRDEAVARLRSEGVTVSDAGRVDLATHRWDGRP